jgi:hypothetical protein
MPLEYDYLVDNNKNLGNLYKQLDVIWDNNGTDTV